jgi:CHAD domain-containing protein
MPPLGRARRPTLYRVDRGVLEQEVKLEAGTGFRIPDLDGVYPGVSAQLQPEQRLQAVYMDTPDLRLARGGLTLRHRSERSSSSAGEWTLKRPEASTGPGVSRREINWPGRYGPVPAEISGLVRAYRRTASLGQVARLVTHRRRTVLSGRSGERLLEIDDDVVSVMDGRRLAARFREVEVEVIGPAPAFLLDTVVARLGEAGAVPSDGRSKLVRAIGPRAGEPPDVVPVPVDKNSSSGEVVRAAIAQGYLRLLAHDLGVRLDEDPEDVHQARVATRRLRSDLRTFRVYLPEDWSTEVRAELGWLAEALGRARDADVLFERLHGEVDALDARDASAAGALLGRLVAERDQARQHLLGVFDTDRYGELLDRLVAAARELPPMKAPGESTNGAPAVALVAIGAVGDRTVTADTTVGGPPVGERTVAGPDVAGSTTTEVAVAEFAEVGLSYIAGPAPAPHPEPPAPDRAAVARTQAAAIVAGPWRHLARAVAALGPEPADEALHEVRIRAKRLRYACEAVAQVAGNPAAHLARAAADLQGVLGDFHDAVVAEAWLRAATTGAPPAQALAAGQLIAHERDDARHCRATWAHSWKRLHRKKLRAWLS